MQVQIDEALLRWLTNALAGRTPGELDLPCDPELEERVWAGMCSVAFFAKSEGQRWEPLLVTGDLFAWVNSTQVERKTNGVVIGLVGNPSPKLRVDLAFRGNTAVVIAAVLGRDPAGAGRHAWAMAAQIDSRLTERRSWWFRAADDYQLAVRSTGQGDWGIELWRPATNERLLEPGRRVTDPAEGYALALDRLAPVGDVES